MHTATPQTRAELRIGSEVLCHDRPAGRLERVVFSPRQGVVTHLVIHRGLLGHQDRVVPFAHVATINDERIVLDLTCEELEQFPTYDPKAFSIPEAEWQAAHGYGPEQAVVSLGGAPAELQRLPAERSGVLAPLADETAIAVVSEGMEVVCRDGRVGRVALVLLDRQTHHATHIVVRQGWLTRRDIIVPLDWAVEISERRIVLDARDWQIEQLPDYRPDEEIAEDVRQALYDAPQFHDGADFFAMQVSVRDGVVTLRGNVRNSVRRIEAERIARRVRGVIDVRNELLADDALELLVAQALRSDGRLQIHDLVVTSMLGLVRLHGRVPDAQQRELAAQVARHVTGVQAIDNQLTVDPLLARTRTETSSSATQLEAEP